MALEELIVAWSKDRPAWQREVMRRVAIGEPLSENDYDQLVDDILAEKVPLDHQFGLEQLPQTVQEDLPVRLTKIERLEHVNALESKDPLSFAPNGLTIVYGDNGSGKSGYARLLKRITRARHKEDVLTDIFRDTSIAKPTALLTVQIGELVEELPWPETSRSELQRMVFFDSACGNAYIANESDFPYRPSALFVMDGLIEACVAVRTRIDAKLVENSAAQRTLPTVPEQARETDAGRFLSNLSRNSTIATLDALIMSPGLSSETIEQVKEQESSLRSSDTGKLRQQLARQSQKLESLCTHFQSLATFIGSTGLMLLQHRNDSLKTLKEAAGLLACCFEEEPLAGVGSSPWKTLWEAARRFSSEAAYPAHSFPFLEEGSLCVLCQQPLEAQGRDRMRRFDEFVLNDTQVRLNEAQSVFDQQIHGLQTLVVTTESIHNILHDLESTYPEIVLRSRELLGKYELTRSDVLKENDDILALSQLESEQITLITLLSEASNAARVAASDLANPEGVHKQLEALAAKRINLEFLAQVRHAKEAIANEVERLKERDILEVAKSSAATTGITKKILELSEESITEVVRDTFTRETERLRLERVTIARTRADKGALLHQPKLVGARQQVTLPKVFSEGERTALGIAAFFTEAHLDVSQSALILDDPVTSLDHVRRGLVASRLAALAEARQVIVFTHDVAFVADLKREASAKGVFIAEQAVTRSRGTERKPGSTNNTHPWKAKDVAARLQYLRQDIARINRESSQWDDKACEDAIAVWAGNLSETWERLFSQEIVGPVLADGGLEVRPMMVKVLARFSEEDHREFDGSYSRVSQWAKRHDKCVAVNYVAPDMNKLNEELTLVEAWYKRVKGYRA
jgi:energy-coupling factor transporter ATP-binding protein EcfA2